MPNTIFNVQSTGDAVLRVTAPTSYDTSLQLLGRRNSATHGFDVTYDEGDERTDLSMISSSVKTKVISIKNNNVGVSYNKPDAKLTIGGDVSLTDYAEGRSATNNAGVGKLFVTQSSASEVEQNLVFQDDAGNKVNISKFIKDTTDGSVTYYDGRDNQFTGVGSPKSRATADLNDNFRNETRRFIWLVDALYDKNCFLIATANANFSDIYTGEYWKFEFQRTKSRITEMSQL